MRGLAVWLISTLLTVISIGAAAVLYLDRPTPTLSLTDSAAPLREDIAETISISMHRADDFSKGHFSLYPTVQLRRTTKGWDAQVVAGLDDGTAGGTLELAVGAPIESLGHTSNILVSARAAACVSAVQMDCSMILLNIPKTGDRSLFGVNFFWPVPSRPAQLGKESRSIWIYNVPSFIGESGYAIPNAASQSDENYPRLQILDKGAWTTTTTGSVDEARSYFVQFRFPEQVDAVFVGDVVLTNSTIRYLVSLDPSILFLGLGFLVSQASSALTARRTERRDHREAS